MKNLIYQFWEGDITPGNQAGADLMYEYAQSIGVEYQFELNPTWPKDARLQRSNIAGKFKPHYGAFKPIFDTLYDQYDNILFCDTDIIPIGKENIFNEFDKVPSDLWIAEEHMGPSQRSLYKSQFGSPDIKNDKRWADIVTKNYGSRIPLDNKGRPRVFNSGVVMYSKKARIQCREKFTPFDRYCSGIAWVKLPGFYESDQNYLHAHMCAFLNWSVMPYKWNSQMFYKPETSGKNRPTMDYRTPDTQFVHLQQSDADDWDRVTTLKKAST